MSDCHCSVGRRTPRLSAAFLAGYCGGYAAGRLAQIKVDVTSGVLRGGCGAAGAGGLRGTAQVGAVSGDLDANLEQAQAFLCPYKATVFFRYRGGNLGCADQPCALPAGHKGPCSAEPGTIVPKSGGRQE